MIEITFEGGKVVTAHVNGHTIRTDQPIENGGTNSAPSPFDLFLASIGTCAGVYVKSFCDNRQIPSEGIRLLETMEIDPEKKIPSVFKIEIELPPDFPEKYRDAVISVADLCLVKKTILNNPKIIVSARIKQ
ncbi:MAG TPA: OsmC family protein [Bacteroidales bacterium]|nr:OsmC family protein [Bacteroidales bacterium]HCI56116.1 osmotically inducible protein OsmC [Bacteroidales bacterium]HOU96693.1 OsmC family protein [Bacteroidales bacterium]HQG37084.1 OsmC family protein [Bacteroidales bacterium]HQG52429.1 OsmC family protein [Bacteroidales bacterium]